jgi:hypothetical protein
MKRLLLCTPLLLVFAGCAATPSTSHHARPVLSRSATLDDVPLRLDVAGLHRRGRIAALDLRLVNRDLPGGETFSIDDTFSREGNDDLDGVLLLDPRTGHELTPLDDDLELGMLDIAPAGSQLLRVGFPAPGGHTADVLVPHFGLFAGVPVH